MYKKKEMYAKTQTRNVYEKSERNIYENSERMCKKKECVKRKKCILKLRKNVQKERNGYESSDSIHCGFRENLGSQKTVSVNRVVIMHSMQTLFI